ncbi:MAG: glucosaminidase domain-containing protein [Moorellaceae bacterium]
MAEVVIHIRGDFREALDQVEEFRRKLAEAVRITPSVNDLVAQHVPKFDTEGLDRYRQGIRQLIPELQQVRDLIQQITSGGRYGPQGTGVIGSIFSRIRGVFNSGAPGSGSPNLISDTPQQIAQLMRAAGLNLTGREVETLSGISNRLAAGQAVPAQSLNALTNIIAKVMAQADEIAEKLQETRKFIQGSPSGLVGNKDLEAAIERKFASLDKVAEYLQTLEEEARLSQQQAGAPAGGGPSGAAGGWGGGPGWLRSGAGLLLGGLRSALGPAATMFSLGALGYGTYEYLQAQQAAGELGARLGIIGAPGSTAALVKSLSELGEQAGYYTAREMAQMAGVQALYGGHVGTWDQLRRDLLATGALGRMAGIDALQAGQLMGTYRQLGGFQPGQEERFADAIATAIQRSGIDPRQFLQANQMLVQAVARQVGNVDVTQLANLQATLDRLGVQYGLTALTGTRGAEMLVQLNQGITAPGGGAFGEFTVLQALRQAVPGLSLPQALLLQRKGLGELAKQPEQFLGFLQNVWQRALRMGGGDETYAELFMQDILHLQPGQIEGLKEATHGFTRLPSEAEIGKISGGRAKTLQEYMQQLEKGGALDTAKVMTDLNQAALQLGETFKDLTAKVAEFAKQHPWAAVGAGSAITGSGSVIDKVLELLGLGAGAKILFGGKGGGSGTGAGKLGELLEELKEGGAAKASPFSRILAPLAGVWQIITGDRSKASTWFGAGGTWGGAELGAALGSLIAPGLGTIVGSILGAVGGEAVGKGLGDVIDKSGVLQKIKEGIEKLGEKMFSSPYSSIPGLNPYTPMGYVMTTGQTGYLLAAMSAASRLASSMRDGKRYAGSGTITADYDVPATAEDFVRRMLPIASQVSEETGLPPSLLLAQWALESGWGTSWLARNAYNFGGIKSYKGYPWGSIGGGQPWAKFTSLEDFGRGVAYFYLHNFNYRKLLADARAGASLETLLQDLTASGYGGDDPSYGAKVGNILPDVLEGMGKLSGMSQKVNWATGSANIRTSDKNLQGGKFIITFLPDTSSPIHAPGLSVG